MTSSFLPCPQLHLLKNFQEDWFSSFLCKAANRQTDRHTGHDITSLAKVTRITMISTEKMSYTLNVEWIRQYTQDWI